MHDVKEKLDAGARVADVGCGKGASALLMAKAFPKSHFFDFVAVFDCLHDMGDPIGASAHVRQSLAKDGTWMIVELMAIAVALTTQCAYCIELHRQAALRARRDHSGNFVR